MNVLLHDAETTITVEGGGWLCGRRREPTLADASAAELLRRGEALPASLRHVRDGSEAVVRLGELPLADSTMDEALGGLLLLLDGGETIPVEVTAEELETALDSSGFTASRRQAGWWVSPPPPLSAGIAADDCPWRGSCQRDACGLGRDGTDFGRGTGGVPVLGAGGIAFRTMHARRAKCSCDGFRQGQSPGE